MREKSEFVCGSISNNFSLRGIGETNKAFQKLQDEFDALPESTKKAMYDILYEHTEKILDAVESNLKYTEPLRIIGFDNYEI